MIDSVTFNNFRSLDALTVPLTQFTMLTGTNCVGKTSVLEGLYCLFSETRLDVSTLSRYNQTIGFALNRTISFPAELIARKSYNYKLFWDECPTYDKETCYIEAKDSNNLTWSWSYKKANMSDLDGQMVANSPIPIDSLTEFALWLWTTHSTKTDKIKQKTDHVEQKFKRMQILSSDGGLHLLPTLESRIMSICKYLDFASIRLLPQALSYSMSKFLTEALKIINPKVTDVRLTDIGSGLSVVLDNKHSVTLGTLGNGSVTFASTLITIFDITNNIDSSTDAPIIILIDEIGAGLHYSVMLDIWKYLRDFAEKHPFIQFVTTSHSYDCVRAFSEAFLGHDNATVVRLHRPATENKIIPTTYSKDQFHNIVSGDWEVRG